MGYDQYLRTTNSQQQGSGEPTWAPVSTRVFGAFSSAPGAATKYCSAAGTTTGASSAVCLGVATQAGTIQNLQANATTAPAGTDTLIFTVLTSVDSGTTWVASTLTCTITGTAISAADNAHQVAVAAGTLFAIKCVSSASTGAGINASFELA